MSSLSVPNLFGYRASIRLYTYVVTTRGLSLYYVQCESSISILICFWPDPRREQFVGEISCAFYSVFGEKLTRSSFLYISVGHGEGVGIRRVGR